MSLYKHRGKNIHDLGRKKRKTANTTLNEVRKKYVGGIKVFNYPIRYNPNNLY